MKETILLVLQRLEKAHGIEILFAIESGSRAWGFASQDSDWDVRFVYRRPLSNYLSITPGKDNLQWLSPETKLDFSGWDIQKALFQAYKSNPSFFEWLHSPIVYTDTGAIQTLRQSMAHVFNPKTATFHYLHLASGNYRKYIDGKEVCEYKRYLYVVRSLLACIWIAEAQSMPPIELHKLMAGSDIPYSVKTDVQDMLNLKQQGELSKGAPNEGLNAWIETTFDKFHKQAFTAGKFSSSAAGLNNLFFDFVVPDFLK